MQQARRTLGKGLQGIVVVSAVCIGGRWERLRCVLVPRARVKCYSAA